MPAQLAYANPRLEIEVGTAGQSGVPTISGTTPISYTLSTSPASLGSISISAQGVIAADAALPEGVYTVSITASNAAGATNFPNVFTVAAVRTPRAPSALRYAPDSLVVNEGTAGQSVAPTVSGTTPISYAVASSPVTSLVAISSQGVISAPATLPAGRYVLAVTVTNSVGAVTFPNAYKVVVKARPPASLTYAPNSLNLVRGTAGTSAVPTISGTAPITYAVSSSPATTGITINAQGVISVANTVAPGTYVLAVQATNAAGTVAFPAAFTVVVSAAATAPSGLVYSPNTLSLTQGSGGTSVVPTISGTTPISYALTSSPTAGSNITINASSGVITVGAGLAVGTYSLTVAATNSVGTVSFPSVYTVTVTGAVRPASLAYAPASLTLAQGSTGTSAVPTITGTGPITYALSVSPANAGITINSSTGVISASSAVTTGTYSVSVTATNAAGSTTFPGVYTVVVGAAAITFTNNVRPLVVSYCGNCHTGGGQTNYTIYANAVANITLILDRVQRSSSTPGFMPKNGSPLTAAQVTMLQQWQAQGLLQ
ncbi:hypothetical protein [Hymenobacter rubidus]|uniref:hypothetical protein n=1 Tax=Hymenobacter rubidus TaxID=1441626 RepID=UPI00191FE713|nr:hypothetical protein [Hymenobacter rubidus]